MRKSKTVAVIEGGDDGQETGRPGIWFGGWIQEKMAIRGDLVGVWKCSSAVFVRRAAASGLVCIAAGYSIGGRLKYSVLVLPDEGNGGAQQRRTQKVDKMMVQRACDSCFRQITI